MSPGAVNRGGESSSVECQCFQARLVSYWETCECSGLFALMANCFLKQCLVPRDLFSLRLPSASATLMLCAAGRLGSVSFEADYQRTQTTTTLCASLCFVAS